MARGMNNWITPAISAGLLTALLFVGGISLTRPRGLDDYFARVREQVDAIPWRIGGWDGLDVEATRAARDLLKPNVIFQRRYSDVSGRSFALLIVHCGNVRDMEGHYPPICYPGQGWRPEGNAPREIISGERRFPAHDYMFSRVSDRTEHNMVVTDLFVLPNPDGPVYSDIDALQAASRSPKASGLGSAQIQFVTSDTYTDAEWSAVLAIFAAELTELIDEVGDGVNAQ